MSNHYYAIRDATKVGRGPVMKVMKTKQYTYVPPGVYGLADDSNVFADIILTHISHWDYDTLDAFGVEVMNYADFNTTYKRLFA